MGKFTAEEIKRIITEWAKDKAAQGEIEFDESFCDGVIVRYKTTAMTTIIPNNPDGETSGFHGKSGLDRTDHYAYEIECQTNVLNLLLAFSYTNISDETKKTCELLLEKYKMMPKRDVAGNDNFRRLCIYSDEKIKDCKEESEIRDAMDKLLYQMKGYEAFVIYKLKEES